MILNQNIDTLSNELQERNRRDPLSQADADPPDTEPFILFLGQDCAQAARVPDLETVASQALKLITAYDIEDVTDPSKVDESDKPKLLKKLYQRLDQIPPSLIFNALRSLFINIPVPVFYQDLAQLVQAGYFNRIITTNFDTLLEQALDSTGMQAGLDYCVTSLGIKSDESARQTFPDCDVDPSQQLIIPRHEPVHIIKLHGDLAQQQINLSQSRIEKALRSQRRFVRSEIKGDMMVVGYRFENDPLNDWLSSTAKSRERLWWISQNGDHKDVAKWANNVAFIDGDAARPDMFFSELAFRLLRQPVLATLGKSFNDYLSGIELDVDIKIGRAKKPEKTHDHDLTIVELRDKISLSQSALFSQEQSASSNDRPPNVEAQIRYQKRQIAKFEDKLRDHPECTKRILELVELIASNALDVKGLDSRSLQYLRDQVGVVQREYKDEVKPNQQVVSAAISTIVILGDRIRVELSEAAVMSDSLRELATYVPSLAARGVIQ